MASTVNYKEDKIKQHKWFPYSVSHSQKDFVIQNGVHLRCPDWKCDESCQQDNPKYWENFSVDDILSETPETPEIGCFGCSFTFGSFLQVVDTWPYLLGKQLGKRIGNFGVPGGGADACLVNLQAAHKKFAIKTAIVLLPSLQRKLLEFEINGLFFQMPIGPHSDWPYDKNISKSYFDKKTILEKIQNIKKDLTTDKDQIYSKKKILALINYCAKNSIKLFVSSWDDETYNFIKTIDVQTLPYYNMASSIERAGDGNHPCRAQNAIWVSKIYSKIL